MGVSLVVLEPHQGGYYGWNRMGEGEVEQFFVGFGEISGRYKTLVRTLAYTLSQLRSYWRVFWVLFLLRSHSHNIKSTILSILYFTSKQFGMYTMMCNHNYYLIPGHFCHSKKEILFPLAVTHFPFPPAPDNHRSTFYIYGFVYNRLFI